MSLWNIDMDWDSEDEVEVPEYNYQFAMDLYNDGFGSWADCVLEASATMDGASEENGIVHSRQTYCNILNES